MPTESLNVESSIAYTAAKTLESFSAIFYSSGLDDLTSCNNLKRQESPQTILGNI